MGEKIAIIGLGMIGYELVKKYNDLGFEVHGITRSDKGFFDGYKNINKHFIDITNENKIKETIVDINPDFVINTAAITNVDLCETEREIAYKTNALAAKYIGEACKKLNIPLCHISTDYVFDGEKGNYVEDDEINPINYYGWTKAEGEKVLNELNHDLTSIVRISVPYCISPVKVNFFMWVLNTLKEGKEVNTVIDQWNTPTYVPELMDGIVKIYERDVNGVLHFGGGEKVSRYEFTLKVAEIFGLDKSLIKPIRSSELGWKANRPADTSLISEKSEKLLDIKLKKVDECLNELKKII
ncbi:dTDP-4-dehydrorhamnose reductase [Methanothermococcus sp.]|uniref:dTDP-4-dehydrorhamnose reductase n=1 Tax=Methanothermococcus sp. TaxID=2614238 RepID=UPI0025E7D9B9|nr:dTDP-4-dehydrorhamnose reductase [Methanothermococcus sp.]